ncbi:DctP family TRAP transporter solute-binding subunit [candidate division KSB1 bacterium]|nr:DctP family TRAP transporter solute-binding subunit [candidate division KSB1 bacterium]
MILKIKYSQVLHFIVIMIIMMLVLLTGCQNSESRLTLKLAHALDTNHPVHKGMVYMANRVRELSEGNMHVKIFANSQLGSERELVELLQIGLISMTKVSASTLENFVPEAKVFSMPFIFKDHDHYWRVLKSEVGKRILLSAEKFWVRGLGYYDAGSRSFYSIESPILKPEDLAGLKVRVMKSQTFIRTIIALGGSATPISWGELYTALQQGVVDAAENNPPSFYYSRHYEICKHYSLDEHASPPDVLLISTHAWNKLTEQQQQILQTAVDESIEYQRKLWKKTETEILKILKKEGVQIYYPEKAPFRTAVSSVYESFEGTSFYDLIEDVRSIK